MNKINMPTQIIKESDSLIRQISEKVSFPLTLEDKDCIEKMENYLTYTADEKIAKEYNFRPGVGISAIQIGFKKRIFAIDFDWEDKIYKQVFINPRILKHSQQKAFLATGEGCLSVETDKKGKVCRYNKVLIKAQDINGAEIRFEYEGFPSVVVQHEMDHLMGILYIDYIDGLVDNEPGENPIIIGESNERDI